MSPPAHARSKAHFDSELHADSAEVAAYGSPVEIVEHIVRLGGLFGSFGSDRDGAESLLGAQISDAALDAVEDLLHATGNNAADAAAFGLIARTNFVEAVRRIPSAVGPEDEEAVLLQLQVADRLLVKALETLGRVEPGVPPALRVTTYKPPLH